MKNGAIFVAAFALLAGTAFAHGAGGGGGGMGGGMGGGFGGSMSSHSFSHVPSGAPLGQPSMVPQNTAAKSGNSIGTTVSSSVANDATATAQLRAANELGKLNAAHASLTAQEHAASNSTVGAIATYRKAMTDALAITDTAKQDAAITAARQQLATSANVTLTASEAAKVDGLLGISGASPSLGTAQ